MGLAKTLRQIIRGLLELVNRKLAPDYNYLHRVVVLYLIFYSYYCKQCDLINTKSIRNKTMSMWHQVVHIYIIKNKYIIYTSRVEKRVKVRCHNPDRKWYIDRTVFRNKETRKFQRRIVRRVNSRKWEHSTS